ncbi:hypothetical protein [Mycobacteroides franklinii]|nr:hypothetical protein [Mycobacteroides franklinii]
MRAKELSPAVELFSFIYLLQREAAVADLHTRSFQGGGDSRRMHAEAL